MAFDFTKIPEQKETVVFEFEGQTLNCVLNLNKLTQARVNEFDSNPHEFALALSTIIESWDAAGLNYPDYDFLRTLPFMFLSRLFYKCMEAASPKVLTAEV